MRSNRRHAREPQQARGIIDLRLEICLRRIVLALCLLAASTTARSQALAPTEEHWFGVYLDGRKIGHMLQSRRDAGDRVHSRQLLSLTLEREGQPLTIESEENTIERSDGTPMSFQTRIDNAGNLTLARGVIDAGRLTVDVDQQGRVQSQQLAWPDDALLTEGQRLAALRAGLAPGTQYMTLAYDPGSLRAAQVLTQVGTAQPADVSGHAGVLVPLDQTTWLDGTQIATQSWVEPGTHALRRLRFPAMGLQLDVRACDRECALAPVQPADVLDAMLVPSPRPLRRGDLSVPLAYRLILRQGDGAAMGSQPGQTIAAEGDGVRVVVDPAGDARWPPQPADTAATRWLESDAPEVIALANTAAGNPGSDAHAMRNMEAFVRRYIRVKSLRIGYASAREVIAGREGDCTEHAVLLAALARARGIPARVATGIAYSPGYGERRDVFVPHAWVLAWVDGKWQGFDAALAGHDAGHIAFSSGDGDPFRFYEGIELLGAVSMQEVERVSSRERAVLRRAARAERVR